MAGTYDDAIKCLLNRYNRLRLIYQAHIHAILDVLFVKEGNGKEQQHFHDITMQHYRALDATKEDSFETLLMAIFELKMDPTTMGDW